MAFPWDVLGLEAPTDAGAIRRAYATRLKAMRPDSDPDGFGQLRAAYETALRLAGPGQSETTGHDTDPLVECRQRRPSVVRPAVQSVTDLLDQKDAVGAARALSAGRDTGALALTEAMMLSDDVLHLLVEGRDLDGASVLEAAGLMGWSSTPSVGENAALFVRLQDRLAAERWLAGLRASAASRRYYLGSQRAAAARLLLGRGGIRLAWLLPPEPPLRRLTAELAFHERWVGRSFDSDRVASARRLAGSWAARWAFVLWLVVLLFPIILTGIAAVPIIWAGTALQRFGRTVLLVYILLVLVGAAIAWSGVTGAGQFSR